MRAPAVLGAFAGALASLAPVPAIGAPAHPSPASASRAVPAVGQSAGPGRDTVPRDTVPADTTVSADTVAGDTTASASDSIARPEAPPFPAELEPPDSLSSATVRSWDREALLAAAPQSLLDFLEHEEPGLTGLSADYFAGPFVALDGVFGAGFVHVIVDGLEMDPLEGGIVDLRRVSLIQVERLRVVREAGSARIEITTISHGKGPAYSRIEAGTGRPSLNTVRGVFANGLGAHVQMAGAGDFLDVAGAPYPAHRLDGWGRLSLMPGSGRIGIEVRGRSESIDRQPFGLESFSRGEAYLHARADLASWLQADGWAGRSTRSADASSGAPAVTARQAALTLTAVPGKAYARASLRARNRPSRPTVEGRLESGLSLNDWLRVEAGGQWSSWRRFKARSGRVGVAVRPRLGGVLDLTLRGSAAAGSRGVPSPAAGTADSITFDALDGVAELRLGPYRLEGRGVWQKVSRQLPFGFAFDSALAAAPGATVGGFEGRADGPAIPVGVLEEHLHFTGVWRHMGRLSGASLRYVPSDLAYGEIALESDLFQNSLHLTMAFGASYRAAVATARPGQSGSELLPSRTLALGRVEIRIDRFRLWWTGHDLGLLDAGDFAGVAHPLGVNLVGVSWEWSN
jgi:hypothetical protein